MGVTTKLTYLHDGEDAGCAISVCPFLSCASERIGREGIGAAALIGKVLFSRGQTSAAHPSTESLSDSCTFGRTVACLRDPLSLAHLQPEEPKDRGGGRVKRKRKRTTTDRDRSAALGARCGASRPSEQGVTHHRASPLCLLWEGRKGDHAGSGWPRVRDSQRSETVTEREKRKEGGGAVPSFLCLLPTFLRFASYPLPNQGLS